MVEMPRKKTEIKVEKIREHLGLNDAKGDTQWSDIRVSIPCSSVSAVTHTPPNMSAGSCASDDVWRST